MGMEDRTEYEAEGPDNDGRFHVKRVEWRGGNRAAILQSRRDTMEQAEKEAGRLRGTVDGAVNLSSPM